MYPLVCAPVADVRCRRGSATRRCRQRKREPVRRGYNPKIDAASALADPIFGNAPRGKLNRVQTLLIFKLQERYYPLFVIQRVTRLLAFKRASHASVNCLRRAETVGCAVVFRRFLCRPRTVSLESAMRIIYAKRTILLCAKMCKYKSENM